MNLSTKFALALAVVALLLLAFNRSEAQQSGNTNGRFMVVVGNAGASTVKINTATGQAWKMNSAPIDDKNYTTRSGFTTVQHQVSVYWWQEIKTEESAERILEGLN